jgi:hypothetical protein
MRLGLDKLASGETNLERYLMDEAKREFQRFTKKNGEDYAKYRENTPPENDRL